VAPVIACSISHCSAGCAPARWGGRYSAATSTTRTSITRTVLSRMVHSSPCSQYPARLPCPLLTQGAVYGVAFGAPLRPDDGLRGAPGPSLWRGCRPHASQALEDRLTVRTEGGIDLTGTHASVYVNEHVAHRGHVHRGVEHPVLANDPGLGVTQQRKVQPQPGRCSCRHLGRIDAQGHDDDPGGLKPGQVLLQLAELLAAAGSKIPHVEDQDNGLASQIGRQGDRGPRPAGERERRRTG